MHIYIRNFQTWWVDLCTLLEQPGARGPHSALLKNFTWTCCEIHRVCVGREPSEKWVKYFYPDSLPFPVKCKFQHPALWISGAQWNRALWQIQLVTLVSFILVAEWPRDGEQTARKCARCKVDTSIMRQKNCSRPDYSVPRVSNPARQGQVA